MRLQFSAAWRRVYLVAEARMPTAGFVAGCCLPRKEIVGMSVNALTFAVYLQRFRTRASRRSDRRRNGSRGHASELFRCRAHGKNDDMARRREDGRLRPSEPCGLITKLYALETRRLQ